MENIFHEHNHQKCIDTALTLAQQRCQQAGVRLTHQREDILRLVWQSHKPLGAYDILEKLQNSQAKRIAPPTVYRALEFWQQLGLIHRISSLNAFIGCNAQHDDNDKAAFLICEHCGQAEELEAEPLLIGLGRQAEQRGFRIQQGSIELKGLCQNCQKGAI